MLSFRAIFNNTIYSTFCDGFSYEANIVSKLAIY
ncbi:MAG: hypothetical protein JWR50_2375 [Mucilaginibacter sp.]|nr:hypothetical protein [Mucilaginibacter sp.]